MHRSTAAGLMTAAASLALAAPASAGTLTLSSGVTPAKLYDVRYGTTDAKPIDKHPAWAAPIAGTTWIGDDRHDWPSGIDGDYSIYTDFTLPANARNVVAVVDRMTDNCSTVQIDEGAATACNDNFNAPTRATVPGAHPGTNRLLFKVHNSPVGQHNPTGLNFKATISYDEAPILEASGVTSRGTDFAIDIDAKGTGSASFANPDISPARRAGEITCVTAGTNRVVFGIRDVPNASHRGTVLREFYLEKSSKGIRVAELYRKGKTAPAEGLCANPLPKMGKGALVRSGTAVFGG